MLEHKPHSIFESARAVLSGQPIKEASKAPDVKKYYDDQEDISKQWGLSARKQLKFEKQKKGSVELIIVKAPSGQELERYQLVKGNGWTKLGESTDLKEAYQPSRYYRAVEENLERLLVLFNPNGQLAKELEREADNVSSEFNKLKGLIEEAIDIWETEVEYTVAMSAAAEDDMIDDMDPSDFDESYKSSKDLRVNVEIDVIDPKDDEAISVARVKYGVDWKPVSNRSVEISGPRNKVIKYLKFHHPEEQDYIMDLYPELDEATKNGALHDFLKSKTGQRWAKDVPELKSLEDLLKNPDPARVKEYGRVTKYVDMLNGKLDKLKAIFKQN